MQQLQACIEQANQVLSRFIVPLPFQNTPVVEIVQYDALLGGKYLRPFLVYATGQVFGAGLSTLDVPAVAVERTHACLLMHDDLPAMDDSDLRRGLPTCHVKFGETDTVLAGDALQTLAFSIISDAPTPEVTDRDRTTMISELARASGIASMCGGQALDLEAGGHRVELDALERIHCHKARALIRVAVCSGTLSTGDEGRERLPVSDKYAESIGLAFQVQDDILGVVDDTAALSKRQGTDQQLGRSTCPVPLGLEQAQNKAQGLVEDARQSLSLLAIQPLDTSALEALADYIIQHDRRTSISHELAMSFDIAKYPILTLVDSTQELRLLPKESLPKPYDELRRYLLDSVGCSSGHSASSLGTVEPTVAPYYVYNAPLGQLIWDVGHQAYSHKTLAGRRDKIGTIRQKGGLHPFPRRGESEYGALSAGCFSTSISAGISIAAATEREGKERYTVCVIGDGTITVGMAFEAMNHASDIRPDMLVILNDNEISTSENVDALNNHLAQLLSGKLYSPLREGEKKVPPGVSPIEELLKHTEEYTKGMIVSGILFEELGFDYIGPVDSHDMLRLIVTLKNMRNLKGPQPLYIMTKKGRSYEPVEKDPIALYVISKFGPSSGRLPKSSGGLPSYSKIFGDRLCETAARDDKLMTVTLAIREGSGMVEFSHKFSGHYFDVATAKQHIVTFVAGLAIGGYKPVIAICSTFPQRAYDQALHDITIQKLPVLFVVDRAGIVGADGQTHQGVFDLSFLHCIPEVVIMTPGDGNECHQMLFTGYHYNDGLTAVRYPHDNTVSVRLTPLGQLPTGKGIVKHHGEEVVVLNFGALMSEVAQVAESLDATLVDMRFIKPLDEMLILETATQHEALVTTEENTIMGGAGNGVDEVLMAHRKPVPVLNIGLPDLFIPQGTQDEARTDLGLNAAGIETKIEAWLA